MANNEITLSFESDMLSFVNDRQGEAVKLSFEDDKLSFDDGTLLTQHKESSEEPKQESKKEKSKKDKSKKKETNKQDFSNKQKKELLDYLADIYNKTNSASLQQFCAEFFEQVNSGVLNANECNVKIKVIQETRWE